MPLTQPEKVSTLRLDLKNFRTIPQVDEVHATNAMIAIKPDWFWPLMESLIDDGYEPTENIIVLRTGAALVVKEGNRRIAALKLIWGLTKGVSIPENLIDKISKLSAEWKKQNSVVPCAIYEGAEALTVERLIARIHAKGEKSGRDKWNPVAKARFARDQRKQSEPVLNLLESYLENGKNVSPQQAERWAGDYPLTVLSEAVQKLAPQLNYKTSVELIKQYPKKHKKILDDILYDIGIDHLGFKELRSNNVWAADYGVTASVNATSANKSNTTASSNTSTQTGQGASQSGGKSVGVNAHASTDPKSVRRKLKELKIKGKGRDKIVTLLDEMKGLKHEIYPHAFCFLLRSVFELSAKAYCADHLSHGGPDPFDKKRNREKELAVLLGEIVNHMTQTGSGGGTNAQKLKLLHGAITEIQGKDRILSVTSMNQLVHNQAFSIQSTDISIMFGNIFPLLVEMNA